jgi:hypothetical protein
MSTIGKVDIAEEFSGTEELVVFETSPQAGEPLERIQGIQGVRARDSRGQST